MSGVQGRVIAVTGAGGGLGRGCAPLPTADGAEITDMSGAVPGVTPVGG